MLERSLAGILSRIPNALWFGEWGVHCSQRRGCFEGILSFPRLKCLACSVSYSYPQNILRGVELGGSQSEGLEVIFSSFVFIQLDSRQEKTASRNKTRLPVASLVRSGTISEALVCRVQTSLTMFIAWLYGSLSSVIESPLSGLESG
jgi:hypothetical protein